MNATEIKIEAPQPTEQQKRLDSYRQALEKLNKERQSKDKGTTAC